MEMKAALVALFLCSLLFMGSVGADGDGDGDKGASSPASSSPVAPCSAKLNVSPAQLIPFNTSSLNCATAWSSRDFILMYKKEGPSLWSFVLSAPDNNGYISVGFSSNGRMVGSSAVAGWIGANGGPGQVRQYYLGGTSPGQCPPDQGGLQLKNKVIVSQSSRLYVAFQLNTTQPQTKLIYALGPKGSLPGSDNLLPEHQDMVSTSIDYVTGQTSRGGGSSSLKETHGALALAGWGVLVPLGVLVARHCKHWDPFWFYAHMSIQGLGFGLGVVTVVTGFSLEEKVDKDVDTHKALGILILVLGSLQVMAVLARPDKSSKVRKYWNWYHWYVGRAAIALAIANIFYGLSLGSEERSWSIGYGVYLGVGFLGCLVLEIRMFMRSK